MHRFQVHVDLGGRNLAAELTLHRQRHVDRRQRIHQAGLDQQGVGIDLSQDDILDERGHFGFDSLDIHAMLRDRVAVRIGNRETGFPCAG